MELKVSWEQLGHWELDRLLAVHAMERTNSSPPSRSSTLAENAQTHSNNQRTTVSADTDGWGAEPISRQPRHGHTRGTPESLIFGAWKVIKERDRLTSELAKYTQYGWAVSSDGYVTGNTHYDAMLATYQRRLNSEIRALLHSAANVCRQWWLWSASTLANQATLSDAPSCPSTGKPDQ